MSTRFLPRQRAFSIFAFCFVAFCAAFVAQPETAFAQLPDTTSPDAALPTEANSTPEDDNALEVTPTPTSTPTATPTTTSTPKTAPAATPMAPAIAPLAPHDSMATPQSFPTEGVSLWLLAQRLKLSLPLPAARIIVFKARRRLELWNGNLLVKTYRVALGANPVGAKSRQHDGRTPEGRFRICTRNATNSAFHIFLGLSYPDVPDAARGVNSGAISWREYALIQRKLASRGAPLWETRLGGWVGIHGGTGSPFAQKQAQKRGRRDWTAGCIALTDGEIEELYFATKMGTPVWVRP